MRERVSPGPATAPPVAPKVGTPTAHQRVLALQGTAGNRSVTQALLRNGSGPAAAKAPKKPKYPATIETGGEKVVVNSEAEAKDAERIVKELPEKYGIDVSSVRSMRALETRSKDAPEELRKKIRTYPWLYKELRGCERAVKHYAPILGTARKTSARKDIDQEVVSIGKVEKKLKKIGDEWKFSDTVLGEYFSEADVRAFSVYRPNETSTVDFPDVDKQLEATATHEMAHGIFASSYDTWVKELAYWLDVTTKSGAKDAEAPPTDYGTTNAREDLAESVMLYFVDRKRLEEGNGAKAGKPGNPCPKRCALIAKLVGEWTPKPAPAKAEAAVK